MVSVNVMHVPREGNVVTDVFAKLSVWSSQPFVMHDHPLPRLHDFLRSDCFGVLTLMPLDIQRKL